MLRRKTYRLLILWKGMIIMAEKKAFSFSDANVKFSGNVGGDPKIFTGREDSVVASFSVAVRMNNVGRDGENIERTKWYRVTAFNYAARIVRDKIRKGDAVTIEGKLFPIEYENRDGELVEAEEVHIRNRDQIALALFADNGSGGGSRRSSGDDGGSRGRRRRRPQEDDFEDSFGGDDEDDDYLGDDFEEDVPRKRRNASSRRGGRRRNVSADVDSDVDDYMDEDML